MNIPQDLKYSEEHEWLRLTDEKTEDGQQIGVVGITDFAQGELGELVYVEVETVGEEVAKGKAFGTLEAVKTTSDLFMPVSGKILEFNPDLDENDGDEPELINNDPYGDGWIVKIAMTSPEEIAELMDAGGYSAMIGS